MTNINKALSRWKEIIIITVLIRLLLFILPLFVSSQPVDLFYSWVKWDGPHYIDIAKNWYQTSGEPALFIVFYPLYPLLVKFFAIFIKNFLVSSILVSVVFSLICSIALFEVVLLDFNKRVAYLSVWFLNIFPTTYFLQASYTESLFLATSLITIYFFRKGLYIRSGLIGVLASMTRINGILIVPLLFMEAKTCGKNLVAMLLTPVGFVIYLLMNYLTFREPFYFSKVLSSHWYKHLAWPWVSIQNLIGFYQSQTGDYYYLFLAELISIFLLTITAVFTYIYVRKSYGVYMFLNLLLFTSTSFIMSTPRYAVILFPLFIALALINNKFFLVIISIIFAILLFYLTNLYTQGKWAF